MNTHWKVFGEEMPQSEIVYFARLVICVALIISCVVMLALNDPN